MTSPVPPPPPPPPPPPDPPEEELNFLALHHLHQHAAHPAVHPALAALSAALSAATLLPYATDYTGASRPLAYHELSARHAHIPQSYLRDVLRPHLPPRAAPTLLATGRFATAPRKRPRPASTLEHSRKRLRPVSHNVASLLHLSATRSTPSPLDRATFALLPPAVRRLKRLVGHHLPVFTAVFDNTARRLITGSDDHLIKIWSTETAYLQHTLRGHDGDIIELAKHPTHPIIVSASSDTTLRVWNIVSGAALHVLDGGNKEVNAVQFSPCPDRPYVVSGGADGSVRLWNADHFDKGHICIPIPERTARPRATSSDTHHPAAATSRAAPASPVLDTAAQGQVPNTSSAAEATPASAAATVHPAPMVSSLPATSQATPQYAVPTLSAAGMSAAGMPSAAAVSRAVAAAPGAVAAAPGASAAAPGSGAATAPATVIAPGSSRPRQHSEHLPSGRYAGANSIVSGSPSYEVLSVGFNAGATRLAVGGTDCVAYLYAVEPPDTPDSVFPQIRLLTTLKGHSEHIIQVLFSRSGDSIVTACRDGTARIWNRTKARLPPSKKRRQSVAGMGHWSSTVLDCRSQIQADSRSVLSGGASGSNCGSIVPRMRRPVFPVSVGAAMWSLTDNYVFTSSSDAKIRIWDAETGKLARVLEAHEKEVYVMDCHPTDKRILLSAGYDGKCILWDIESGTQLRKFFIPDRSAEHAGPQASRKRPSISDGQFSSDGLSFAVSDTSGAINLFGVGSGEATALAPEEQFFSNDCAPFRRDGQNRAVDENTGILLHLMSKGRLCDREFRPYPPELQPSLPLPKPAKDQHQEADSRDSAGGNDPSSSNVVENKNRDALLLRAKEFRENQEKEDRRLLREAREARRRLIIEKERASLEKDAMPFRLTLRDFEVLDTDCDDSDEDFDGGEALEKELSDSSTSSEEEDDDDGNDDGGNCDDDEIRPVRRTRTRNPSLRRRSLRGTPEMEKRPRSRPRNHRPSRNTAAQSPNSGDSGASAGNDSPGYEIGSQDSDSDNSAFLEEEKVEMDVAQNPTQARSTGKQEECQARSSTVGLLYDAENTCKGGKSLQSTPSANHDLGLPKLRGATVGEVRRRMKINVENAATIGPPATPVLSTSGHPVLGTSEHGQRGTDSRLRQNDTALTQNNIVVRANSLASFDGRGHPNDTAGLGSGFTPRNPSFTSERKDNTGRQRSSKPVEDHQEDTASYVRPRMVSDDLEDRVRPSAVQDHITNQQSSAEKSPLTQRALNTQEESGVRSEFGNGANGFSQLHRLDGHEKSLLSDSPARLRKKNWKSRTRSGTAKDGHAGAPTPVMDIEELARREMAMLEAQGSRRHGRKRRRHPQSDSNGEESGDEEAHRSVGRRDREDTGDAAKRLKSQRRRGGKGNSALLSKEKGEAENNREDEKNLAASAWLRAASNRYTYVPQLGDDVMYFPEGHATAMGISKAAGLDPLAGKAATKKSGKEWLDGTTFPNDSSPSRFQIIDLSYEFPVPISSQRLRSMNSKTKNGNAEQDSKKGKTIVVLTMRVVSGMKKRAGQNDRFVLSYYPVDAPEYLVLTSRVESALNRSWKASDRFRILFLNERRAWQYFTGTVRRVKPSIRTVMWNTVDVEYDNEGDKDKASCEYVSPWELEAFDLLQGTRGVCAQYTHNVRSSTVEPGLFPFIAKEFETIRAMEANWRVQLSWLDTVDTLASIRGYCNKVPCPMDLSTVLVRLCTGYYRHFCSFIHDLTLLKNNAIRFHGARSEIGMISSNVCTRLMETAERTRLYFLSTMIGALPQQPGQSVGHPAQVGSRTIRPRPTHGEIPGLGPLSGQHTASNHLKQFPVPLTPRQVGAAFPIPSQYMQDNAQHQSGLHTTSRMWPAMRPLPGNSPGHVMQAGQCLGTSLPPALPGAATHGAASRGARASRVGSKGPSPRHSSQGPARRSGGRATRAHASSPPTPPATVSVPQSAGASHSAAGAFATPATTIGNQYQQVHIAMMANTGMTNDGARGSARRIAPSNADPRGMVRLPPQYNAAQAVVPEHPLIRGYVANGIGPSHQGVLPIGVAGPSHIAIQPSEYGVASRQNVRGGNAVGDGGTHSWGRSMEGAGGIFPLQATTSDSHLPVPVQTGRSQSPISPHCRRDVVNRAVRQQGSSAVNGSAAPYHEHSTISMAAAESTMSCGGAEVAMQAATADSEVAMERMRTDR